MFSYLFRRQDLKRLCRHEPLQKMRILDPARLMEPHASALLKQPTQGRDWDNNVGVGRDDGVKKVNRCEGNDRRDIQGDNLECGYRKPRSCTAKRKDDAP